MKKRTKLLTTLLALALSMAAFGTLAGCKSKDNNQGNLLDSSVDSPPDENEQETPLSTEGLEYTLSADGTSYSVTGYTGTDTVVYIPDAYNGLPVNVIGAGGFMYCDLITEIHIPDSVTFIAVGAFYGCRSLTEIVIPDSVTPIAWGVFEDCDSLIKVVIPNSVAFMAVDVFYDCSPIIYCEAKSQPSAWDRYWNYSDCPVVWDYKNNDVAEDGYMYTVIDGVRYGIKDGVATVVCQPQNITSANIPLSITYKGAQYSVTSIGEDAFRSCYSLTEIIIPNSVTEIGYDAFWDFIRSRKAIFDNFSQLIKSRIIYIFSYSFHI